MIFGQVQIHRVTLKPLRSLPVSGFSVHGRQVLRITLKAKGVTRQVDCSPLCLLHRETLEDCLAILKSYFSREKVQLPVSVATAMDFLFLQHEDTLVAPGTFENTALLRLQDACPAEARVCKVKLTQGEIGGGEAYLTKLLDSRPDRIFRLDFNQGLEVSSYAKIQNWLNKFPIEYIEEPFTNISMLKSFAREFPLALDEHLGCDAELDGLAKAWVIKPNVRGFAETRRRFSDQSPIKKILSNVFESDETLQLYAGAYRNWCCDPQPLGFGTAFYFPKEDSVEGWNPRVFQGPWPKEMFASMASVQGELLWET